jgi:hypothetical protein
MKHLQYYLDAANDTTRISKYSPFLGSQYSAVVINGTDRHDDIVSPHIFENSARLVTSRMTRAQCGMQPTRVDLYFLPSLLLVGLHVQ